MWCVSRARYAGTPKTTAAVVTLAGALALGLAGCSARPEHTPGAIVFGFGAHLDGELQLPTTPGLRSAPLVVLVPGGGWTSADPSGLVPLAGRLAAAGLAAATLTYRVGADGRFPAPVADVLCGVAAAAEQARAHHLTPSPIVLVGHSSGAQLAAVAALAGSRFRGACAAEAAPVDALIGLAGPYDITRFGTLPQALLGTTPAEDPQRWRQADPLTWATQRAAMPVLLAAGTADDLVPPDMSTRFAQALRAGGHRVRLLSVAGATHAGIYQPEVIAQPIIDWVRALG